MIRKLYKHKLLLDENLPVRSYLPKLNSVYDVKHISEDLHKDGIKDKEVYELAKQQGRLIVTHNYKDFRPLAENSVKSGVIGVSQNMTEKRIDTILVAFLRRTNPKSLYGVLHYISGETK